MSRMLSYSRIESGIGTRCTQWEQKVKPLSAISISSCNEACVVWNGEPQGCPGIHVTTTEVQIKINSIPT